MKLTLVPNWKNAHKWASIWWSIGGIFISTVALLHEQWLSLDPQLLALIPNAPTIGLVLFLGTIVGRVLLLVKEQTTTVEKTDGSDDA